MKAMSLCKTVGITVLAFGVGVLISFFLPESVLAVIEAIVLITVGVLFFLRR